MNSVVVAADGWAPQHEEVSKPDALFPECAANKPTL